jgi:hypothetical protein
MQKRMLTLIAINILYHRLWNTTLHCIFVALPPQLTTMIVTAPCIERPLQCIALPAEHIITMVAVAGSIFQS